MCNTWWWMLRYSFLLREHRWPELSFTSACRVEKWNTLGGWVLFILNCFRWRLCLLPYVNCWPSVWPLRVTSIYILLTISPRNRRKGHESKGNDHQLKMFLIVTQILLVSLVRNVKRNVLRICILMLGCKGWKLWGVRRGLSPDSWGKLFVTMERSGLCHWNSIEVVIVFCSYAEH